MYKKLIITVIAILISTYAFGAEAQTLEQRVAALEAEQNRASWHENFLISGTIEVEASYTDQESSDSTSDLTVATAELVVEKALSENSAALLSLLYEEDGDGLDIDVAILSYAFNDSGFSLILGQDYMPFGSYSTALVSDPLTSSLGETRETALVAVYEKDFFAISTYLFNGDQDKDGRDTLSNYGGRIAFVNDHVTLGADYISNLADSDNLQDKDYGYSTGVDVVAGASFYGSVTYGPMQFVAERIRALDKLGVDGNNSQPRSTHYELSLETHNVTYGVAFQETEEALFLGLPEERISVGVSTELSEHWALGVEYAQDDDYSVADGGTGLSTDNIVFLVTAGF